MKHATICFLVDHASNRLLLGHKKRGFGVGKMNGFGGKIHPGESPLDAVIREVAEECGLELRPEDVHFVGSVRFDFPSQPAFDHDVRVFLANRWTGTPRETEEMAPSWVTLSDIPYDRMWQDDRYWLPTALSGLRFEARFTFADDNETVAAWWRRTAP